MKYLCVFCVFLFGVSSAWCAIVDPGDGTLSGVSFNPSELIVPVVTVIVALVSSVACIWLIVAGVRFIRSFILGGGGGEDLYYNDQRMPSGGIDGWDKGGRPPPFGGDGNAI